MNKKQAYEEKLKAQLDEWNAKIDVLKAKAEKTGAEARVDYRETIEELQKKRTKAKDKLQELRTAGDDAWKDLKTGVEQAWSSFGDAVDSAVSRFK
ncbi:MAG: coiled coil domain-containing protein [Desulfuromonadales bacterium]